MKSDKFKGSFLLLLAALIWGSSFIVMKSAVDFLTPAVLLFLRFSLAALLLSLLFVVIILFLKRKINTQEAKTFSTWILCVVLTEIVVTLCLTPLWLDMMYHIPWTISLCIRVVKECAILPIEIFIGYSLIPFLRRIWVHLEK